jgi:type IV secretory pathway VirB10-like protein
VEWRRYIRADIAGSAIVHLSIVALLILFTEVHPFGAVPPEPITVDIVTEEVDKKPEPVPTPAPQLPLPDKPTVAPAPAEQPKQAAAPAMPQAAPPPPPPPASAQKPSPQPARRNAGPSPAASASPALGYTPPEPDVTVKYHVMLGLPGELPPPSSPAGKPGDGVDATASTAADVESSLVAQFRRRLKSCSKLPASIAPSDNVMIKLRVLMASDGTLAAEPILIEASASEKGPLLMQGAISALQACQPYAMLPKDRYGEWKVIDLTFTPQQFNG